MFTILFFKIFKQTVINHYVAFSGERPQAHKAIQLSIESLVSCAALKEREC